MVIATGSHGAALCELVAPRRVRRTRSRIEARRRQKRRNRRVSAQRAAGAETLDRPRAQVIGPPPRWSWLAFAFAVVLALATTGGAS